MRSPNYKKYFSIIILLTLLTTGSMSTSAILIDYNQNKSNIYNFELDSINDNLLDKKISLLMKFAKFPSISACIVKNDQIVWEKGYGYYDLTNEKIPDSNTIYLIASITKTIVGTALMQLFEEGYFTLDDDVDDYLPFDLNNPHFPDDPITFRMLLSHTSSLNTNTRNEYYWFNFSGDPPFSFFPDPFLEEFLIPGGKYYHENVWSSDYKPGEHAMYANIGFDIISYLVEIISGETFLNYCQENIFDPLEMYNTSFNLSTLNIENVAKPYFYYFGNYYQINELSFIYGDITPKEPYWKIRCFPAGGLYTTINDLSHFLIAHMNNGLYKDNRILDEDTVEIMHNIDPENEIGYGLAWMEYPIGIRYSAMGHGGDIIGVDTWMLYIPSENLGVIYFANGNPAYGLTPIIGSISFRFLLYSLFIEGGLNSFNY